jgi:hypothetical protein
MDSSIFSMIAGGNKPVALGCLLSLVLAVPSTLASLPERLGDRI